MKIGKYTLPFLFINTVRQHGERIALARRHGSVWQTMTYQALAAEVTRVVQFLKKFGIQPGDRVAILSENRPEWAMVDLAMQCLGAINVPLYHTQSEGQLEYLLGHCGARLLFVSGGELYKKVERIHDRLPGLQMVIHFDELLDPPLRKDRCQDWKTVLKPYEADRLEYLEIMSAGVMPAMCASIVYTSGTTGKPKGVMLSHQNFVSNVEGCVEALPLNCNERVLSFLPLSHVFERTCGYYTIIGIGGSIYYARSIDTVADDMGEVHPTAVVCVPRLFEKMHAAILQKVEAAGKRKILDWAVDQGRLMQDPVTRSLAVRIKYAIGKRLVFSKLKQRTGGKLRFFISGGAPLQKSLGEFFSYAGLPIIEGYGLTETAPVVCCNRMDNIRFGSIGLPFFNEDVKCAADGELLARGPNIMMGYYNDATATTEAIDGDGWFHTGDLARIDDEGRVWITGRKKQIIVLSNGKKISPEPIENAIAASRFVDQCVLFGDNRNYVTAIVVLAEPYLRHVAQEHAIEAPDVEALLLHPVMTKLFMDDVAACSKDFARFEQAKRVLVRLKPFTQDEATLTPSLKIVRKRVYELLDKDIEAVYARADGDLSVSGL